MSIIPFNPDAFRALFPFFSTYTDDTLNAYFDMATAYISNENAAGLLSEKQRTLALNLATAHVAYIGSAAATGDNSGAVQSSSIDKISVSYVPPPVQNGLQLWLAQTTYGQQLWALLKMASAGGLYYGGRNTISAFRR